MKNSVFQKKTFECGFQIPLHVTICFIFICFVLVCLALCRGVEYMTWENKDKLFQEDEVGTVVTGFPFIQHAKTHKEMGTS